MATLANIIVQTYQRYFECLLEILCYKDKYVGYFRPPFPYAKVDDNLKREPI